jgi:hypothetical protein
MDAKQAKAEAKAAGGRLWKAFLVLLGSRATAGIACLFAISFLAATIATPERLPPVGGLTLVAVGLPPLELGKEKEILGDIAGAADRQGAVKEAKGFFAERPKVTRIANWLGLALAGFVLVWGLRQQTRLWKRGVRPF